MVKEMFNEIFFANTSNSLQRPFISINLDNYHPSLY